MERRPSPLSLLQDPDVGEPNPRFERLVVLHSCRVHDARGNRRVTMHPHLDIRDSIECHYQTPGVAFRPTFAHPAQPALSIEKASGRTVDVNVVFRQEPSERCRICSCEGGPEFFDRTSHLDGGVLAPSACGKGNYQCDRPCSVRNGHAPPHVTPGCQPFPVPGQGA